ncbi:competence protein ComK [Bacillus thermotolerans]|uniref:competence protein ComK n=1 Tax=Bacillus thermotolerans TaxID=1221996 RepID=UPI00057CFE8C|nr:competence protein ComK [Bacillus thermotolerans]KKB42091.1 hypothetical protein QY96_01565 [Bacillus thermotolerans]
MDSMNIKQFVAAGQAFVPVNMKESGRDGIKVFYKDGTTEILPVRCDTFLKQLLTFFGTSVSANRERYGKLVSKKQLVPVALSYGYTLIPFVTREPIGRQTRNGWIVAKEITNIQRYSSGKTVISLDHHEILVHHTKKFCFDQLKNSKCIEMYYSEIHEPHRQQWPVSSVSLHGLAYS